MTTANPEIVPFCLLAQSQKGRACSALVQQVLGHRKIFLFGELLAIPSIASLAESEFAKDYRTLELFAFGTYRDYVSNKASFLDLTEAQEIKLKQLSLLSMAKESNVLSFATLREALFIENNRDLEDLIIDSIYSGLFTAKIDQYEQCLRIIDFLARDVRREDLSSIITALEIFQKNITTTANNLCVSSELLRNARKCGEEEQEETLTQAEEIKSSLKNSIEAGSDPAGLLDEYSRHGGLNMASLRRGRGSSFAKIKGSYLGSGGLKS